VVRVLAILTDAFGGYGGIALYNRDVLTALCNHPAISEVVAVPRVIPGPLEAMPRKLRYEISAAENTSAFLRCLARQVLRPTGFQAVYCGHINLMPIAWLAARLMRIPVVLQIYGIDAWQPTRREAANRLVNSAHTVVAISNCTRDRFLKWSGIPSERCRLLPNAIHLENYGPGERDASVIERYGLAGKRVLLTLGRIVSKERGKGFDEVLELLPRLLSRVPEIIYVIAGDGDYRPALEQKARDLGLAERVVFTGKITEQEKPSLFRCADVYVMPSRGEGFGFVFLEAMACGIPVIGSSVDGSRDAVLDGQLGQIVDPDDSDALLAAILKALQQPRVVPKGLEYFAFDKFCSRLHTIIDDVTSYEATV
jgi:glycosyltransferase involved in cell wall biosynthesis